MERKGRRELEKGEKGKEKGKSDLSLAWAKDLTRCWRVCPAFPEDSFD